MAGATPVQPGGGERLILPVGHYLGPHHRLPGAPAWRHRVRVGREPRSLWSDEQFLAWMLARGILDELDGGPWTRASVQEQGRAFGLELSGAVDDLLAEGLLVELAPGDAAGMAAFAAAHRLRGLLLGLGQAPDAPDEYLIGLPGHAAVAVPRLGYEAWLWGQRAPSLWSACERIALAHPGEEGGPQARPSPAEVLRELVETLHPLLAADVAYLDVVERRATDGTGAGGG